MRSAEMYRVDIAADLNDEDSGAMIVSVAMPYVLADTVRFRFTPRLHSWNITCFRWSGGIGHAPLRATPLRS